MPDGQVRIASLVPPAHHHRPPAAQFSKPVSSPEPFTSRRTRPFSCLRTLVRLLLIDLLYAAALAGDESAHCSGPQLEVPILQVASQCTAVSSIVEQQRSTSHRLITVAGGSLGRQVALDAIGRIFELVAVVAAPSRPSPPSPTLRRSQFCC